MFCSIVASLVGDVRMDFYGAGDMYGVILIWCREVSAVTYLVVGIDVFFNPVHAAS